MVAVRLAGFLTLIWLAIELWDRGILQVILLATTVLIIGAIIWRAARRRINGSGNQLAQTEELSSIVQSEPIYDSVSYTDRLSSVSRVRATLSQLPAGFLDRSGSVFYTGRSAFNGPSPLYILGLNPGGDPSAKCGETIRADIEQFYNQPQDWSAYLDESWEGRAPGTQGMQPRILHLLRSLKLHPHHVPASNIVFVRSRGENDLANEKSSLMRICLPVHKAVFAVTRPKVILCFGTTAGSWMRQHIGAKLLIDEFRETNNRGWKSQAHMAADGRIIVTATHPSRANWCNPESDPTPLVARCLLRR